MNPRKRRLARLRREQRRKTVAGLAKIARMMRSPELASEVGRAMLWSSLTALESVIEIVWG